MARRDDLQPTSERLRSLIEVEIPAGRVISLFVDLDPSEFGVIRARASQVSSLVDGLSRTVEALADELAHDELTALRSDRDRIRDELGDLDAEGARGLALYACSPADLWEVLRLPFSVGPDVVVDVVPHVAPLLNGDHGGTWAVAVVSRSAGQVLVGGPDGLRELLVRDDDVHGQHDQGGWSQARYERSVDREADEHVRAFLDTVRRLHERRRFDHLLVVAGPEVWASVEHGLHAELRDIFAGRVDADIPGASPDQVLAVVRPEMHRVREQRERELLARLEERLGRGERAAAGLQPTLDALLQGRVETLLLLDGFAAPGVVCADCGWMGADPDTTACPVDGERPERRDDIVEAAIASALGQDADVVRIVGDDPPAERPGPPARVLQLQGHGSIAALLRF
jgi:hypothetical protein